MILPTAIKAVGAGQYRLIDNFIDKLLIMVCRIMIFKRYESEPEVIGQIMNFRTLRNGEAIENVRVSCALTM